jgi:pimeloyl-ACP methyl ester carboxylesterase
MTSQREEGIVLKKHMTIGNTNIRWEEQGEGIPVVFIHGIPTSPDLWRYVIPSVQGARCLAFEMVGYGDSIAEGENQDISVAAQADYLASWLRRLDVEKAVLVGHDLGGGVAQIAAVRHPDICQALLLTNAICYDSWPIPSVKMMRTLAPATRHLPDTAGKQVLRTLLMRGHDDRAKVDESLEIHWRPYAEHEGAEALVRQMKALDVNDTLAVADELPNVHVPTRIVWGTADQFQKLKYGERLARDLEAPLRRIEGAKHFTPEDHPDALVEELDKLVAVLH